MLRLLRSLSAKWRARQRAIDVKFLWPAIWAKSERRPLRFIMAASVHAASDPAWRVPSEWQRTHQDPGVWAARQEKQAIRARGGDGQ